MEPATVLGHACLAFACRTSLAAMRSVTEALVAARE
jgi:hypothetical protein